MADSFTAKEYGWIESSDSKINIELFTNEIEFNYRSSDDEGVPFPQHGPVVVADPSELSNWKDFWSNFAIGFILDYIKFSGGHLQHIINATWRIRGSISIVGRDSYFYLLYFDHLDDLNHICNERPWSIDGALFVLEK